MPTPDSPDRPAPEAAPKRQLTLFDSTCIIVGIIIGAGIYESTPLIASSVPNVEWLVGVWLLGGLLSLIGAFCYAELATAYPRQGGDYVYLTRAFGRAPGFLFAWSQLWVIRPGSIGAMAYVFARYADQLVPLSLLFAAWYRSFVAWYGGSTGIEDAEALLAASQTFGGSLALIVYAAASVLILSGINIVGVREGKWTQNVLTTAKVVGLAGIFLAGLLFVAPPPAGEPAPKPGPQLQGEAASHPAEHVLEAEPRKEPPGFSLAALGLAMIFVLFTYGGWNEMAYVGAEVRDPQRNIFRALVLGTLAVTVIYLLVTLAFVHGLGFEGTRNPTDTVAQDVLQNATDRIFNLPARREALQGELAEVSALIGEPGQAPGEAAQQAVQRQQEINSRLGWIDWLARLPGRMICVLICISALGAVNGMIFTGARIYYAMGTEHRLYAWLGRWSRFFGTPVWSLVIQGAISLALVVAAGWLEITGLSPGGFTSMVILTAPLFWFFLLLVGISVVELREREPDTPRPYRVPGYPVTPVLFCLSSLFMLYSCVVYAVQHQSWEALWSVVIMVLGLAMCFCDPRPKRSRA